MPTWKDYKNQRVLTLREVVTLSLNAHPDKKNIEEANKNEEFKENFEKRIALLGRMMSRTPTPGYVTFVKNVEFNKEVKLSRNRTVDVLSCIDRIARDENHSLPKEFLALRKSLKKIPLPGDSIEESALKSLSGRTIAEVNKSLDAPKTSSERQSKANQTKKYEQLAAMFYAVVCDCYGHDVINSENEKQILAQIDSAIKDRRYVSTRGLSSPLIREALAIGASKTER